MLGEGVSDRRFQRVVPLQEAQKGFLRANRQINIELSLELVRNSREMVDRAGATMVDTKTRLKPVAESTVVVIHLRATGQSSGFLRRTVSKTLSSKSRFLWEPWGFQSQSGQITLVNLKPWRNVKMIILV